MATFRARYDVLQSIVKSWQLGHEVIVGEVGSHGKSAQCEGEAMVDECPDTNNKITKKVNVGEKMENAESGQPQFDHLQEPEDGKQLWTNKADEKDEENNCDKLQEKKKTNVKDEEKNGDKLQDSRTLLSTIKMPPKMLKRGRPKGAEVPKKGKLKKRMRI